MMIAEWLKPVMSLSTKIAERTTITCQTVNLEDFVSIVDLLKNLNSFFSDENLQVSGRMNASDLKTCSDEAIL